MRRYSLFRHRHDRVAFVAYFLGAVVPLATLAFALTPTGARLLAATWTWTSTIGCVGLLSLAAFFALRRTTREALRRMETDNRRLRSLLEASRALSGASDLPTAAHDTARLALEMTGGDFAAVLKAQDGRTLVVESAGTSEEEARGTAWSVHGDLEEAMRANTPRTSRLPDGRFAAVLPLRVGRRARAEGVLLTVTGPDAELRRNEMDALATLGGLAAVSLVNADLQDAQRNFFAHVTRLLTRALDAHLGRQEEHGHRVARLSNRVARALELADERRECLHWAALLHDIGMLGVPRDEHDDDDAREPHARLGHDMLAPIRFWENAAPIVLHHHERHDGTGYPDGLAGDTIPLEARILAVCDAFDAMVSENSYKPTKSVAEALDELRRFSGTQFDPRVVETFLTLVEDGIIDVEDPFHTLTGVL